MSLGLVGRVVAVVGIVAGLLAIGLDFITGNGASFQYSQDGTITAFLLILLSFASYLPAEIGRDTFGAAAGAAAFGLYLFIPASAGFDHFGFLGPGAWLGLCTALIPIGARIAREKDGVHRSPPPKSFGPSTLAAVAGLVLIVVGIWFDAGDGGPAYWNLSASGHALGILMLVLVALNAVACLTTSKPDTALIVAATTFGLVEAQLIANAFGEFGLLGAGGWIEACGGIFLLAGVAGCSSAAKRAPIHVGGPSPAAAQ